MDALRLTPLGPAEVEVEAKLSPAADGEEKGRRDELAWWRIAEEGEEEDEDADVVAREESESGRGR